MQFLGLTLQWLYSGSKRCLVFKNMPNVKYVTFVVLFQGTFRCSHYYYFSKLKFPTTEGLYPVGNNTGNFSLPLVSTMYVNLPLLNISYAAAAKSLQSRPTLRHHRRQPTKLPHPWDSPGKNTEVGCHFLLQCMKVKSEREVAQSCLISATPWTAAYQAPLSMGFSRQEYWNGLPLSSPVFHISALISCLSIMSGLFHL